MRVSLFEMPGKAPRGELLTAPIVAAITAARARVARQLQEIAARHGVADTEEFARRIEKARTPGSGPKIAALTIRRWLRQENDASRRNLQRVAEAFGETVEQAFPEAAPDYRAVVEGVVHDI